MGFTCLKDTFDCRELKSRMLCVDNTNKTKRNESIFHRVRILLANEIKIPKQTFKLIEIENSSLEIDTELIFSNMGINR